jgi:phage gpG-like protein
MAKNGLSITFDDTEIKRKLRQVGEGLRREAITKGLNSLGQFLVAQIKLKIIDIDLIDIGNLLNSVQAEDVVLTSFGGYIEFGPHTVYAAIHEFGGIIYPTNGPYLIFRGKDGNWVSVKSVQMPARPYIRPTLDEHGQAALDLMGQTIGSIIEGEWSK